MMSPGSLTHQRSCKPAATFVLFARASFMPLTSTCAQVKGLIWASVKAPNHHLPTISRTASFGILFLRPLVVMCFVNTACPYRTQAGTLEVDYVSTSRPLAGNGEGAARSRRKKPMSTKKFHDMLGELGLGSAGAWIVVVKTDAEEDDVGEADLDSEDAGQFDRIINEALREVGCT